MTLAIASPANPKATAATDPIASEAALTPGKDVGFPVTLQRGSTSNGFATGASLVNF